MAMDLGLPILPTWIAGAYAAMRPDSVVVRTGSPFEVRFGAPIETPGRGSEAFAALMAEVRGAVETLRG